MRQLFTKKKHRWYYIMQNDQSLTLYKYKTFDTNSLDALVNDKVYLSNPQYFNDPLDCKPHIEDDIGDIDVLIDIATKLIYRDKLRNNYNNFLPLFREHGDIVKHFKTVDAITSRYAQETMQSIHDAFANTDDENEYRAILLNYIENLLLERNNKGVLSLASDYNCPLMWSHYGDQHNGICIGYKTIGGASEFLARNKIDKIDYEKSRIIKTSLVKEFVYGIGNAEYLIDQIIYFRKAPQWAYEKEFRKIGDVGLSNSPFILSDITFGLRCKDSIKYSVVKALTGRLSSALDLDLAVKFYQIEERKGSFELIRSPVTLDDFYSFPKDNLYNRMKKLPTKP